MTSLSSHSTASGQNQSPRTSLSGQGEGPDALAARLAEEMAERWFKGERPLAEDFLNRHPELWAQPQAAAHLIHEEISLRQGYTADFNPEQVVSRFPQWHAQLAVLLDCHRLLQLAPVLPRFPELGETLGDFRMIAQLGRGAAGRVYLAAQLSLNDRPVVLKLSPCSGREHQEHLSLARLQHTHIVPLYAAQDFPERNLRLLCLPYFGGTTLDCLLERMGCKPVSERMGKDLLAALDEGQPGAPDAPPPRSPQRQRLAEASYVDAICIFGICLADALQHAHKRDLLHLDLKPANVLLAADGQPMLLDFHLAQPPLRRGERGATRLGGTALYMSPEQEKGLSAIRQQQPIPTTIDARSDIYSLGLVLFQALGGALPVDIRAPAPLRQYNPQVSIGLADIVQKCMAPDPRDRYADAAALAADLDRHLSNLPLRGVANRSFGERWEKWRQRRPYGLVVAASILILAACPLLLGRLYYQRYREAETALAEGTHYFQTHEYKLAADTLGHGLSLARTLPLSGALVGALDRQLRSAEVRLDAFKRSQAALTFHQLADEIRFQSLNAPSSAHEQKLLAEKCKALWQIRHTLLERTETPLDHTDTGPGGSQIDVKSDLRDVGIIWANICARFGAGTTVDDARREALRILAETEESCGTSPILLRERQGLAAALGHTDLTRESARLAAHASPRSAWEHAEMGRCHLQAGDLERAALELDQALALEPQNFWANYYQGVCAYRMKRHRDALSAFRVCVALRPDATWCYHNRALVLEALERDEQALRDYDRALQLDAGLVPSLVNRGLLHFRMKRYAAALEDFEGALEKGADRKVVQSNIAMVRRAQERRDR